LLLLFPSSLVGGLLLIFTYFFGFVGKILIYFATNFETNIYALDYVHLQMATLIGASMLMMSQFVRLHDEETQGKTPETQKEDLIDFD